VAVRRYAAHGRFRPELVGFLADVAELHSVPSFTPEVAAGPRSTFAEMTEEFVADPWVGDEPYDLALVAHAWADAEPGWPGCVLTTRLPGAPPACGISDQGVTSVFAALQVAAAYAAGGVADRIAVVALDQSLHLIDRSTPASLVPTADGSAAIVLTPDGELGDVAVHHATGVFPASVAPVVDDLIRAAEPGVLVVGATLAQYWTAPTGMPVIVAPADLPCVGPWLALAEFADAGRSGRVGILDYEPGTLEIGLVTVDIPESRPES
jgi:hypothetical protein